LIFSAWLLGVANLLQSQRGFSSRYREIGRAWNPGSSYPLTIWLQTAFIRGKLRTGAPNQRQKNGRDRAAHLGGL